MGIKAAFDGKENSNQIKTTRIIKGSMYWFSLSIVCAHTEKYYLLQYRGIKISDTDIPKIEIELDI